MTLLDPGLLQAVLDDPDNDELRLICADWWEDRGEYDRAELVRVQMALANLPSHKVCLHGLGACGPRLKCPGCDLRRRERQLLVSPSVLDEATKFEYLFPDAGRRIREWRRGFVHGVRCTSESWVVYADAILAQQPVREVMLTTLPPTESAANGYEFVWCLPHHPDRQSIADEARMVGVIDWRRIYEAEWPDITFRLVLAYTVQSRNGPIALTQELVEDMMVPANLVEEILANETTLSIEAD